MEGGLKSNRILKIFYIVFVLVGLSTGIQSQSGKKILRFNKNDTLEKIREKIRQNGYQFKVRHNWVFDMTPEEKENFYGRQPYRHIVGKIPVTDDPGPLVFNMNKQTLPDKFDWRNHNGHSYIGPVRDQGYCGSCYAFGATAAAEGTYNLAIGRTDADCIDLSESFIMWCLGSLPQYYPHFYGCEGADYDYQELQALVDMGIVRESDFPYITINPGGCTHWNDAKIIFTGWYRIPCGDIDAIKTAIMTYGVVDAAVMTTSAFEAYDSGIYQDGNDTCSSSPCYYTPTNHAISLVGWDDGQQVFILRNSWNQSWGEDGYMRIKYNSAAVACEVCYLVISDIVIQLSVSREDLNIWVFNQQYASIEFTVDKINSVDVSKYIIYKKESSGPYQALVEISDSQLLDGSFTHIDKYLDASSTYSYKVVAFDSQNFILATSTEISI